MKQYQAFVRNPDQLPQGQEIEIVVKDLTPGPRKYNARRVKAIVSSAEALPGADALFLRSFVGIRHPRPWAIKIIRELPGGWREPPYTDLSSWRK